jgi:hypothetical protein
MDSLPSAPVANTLRQRLIEYQETSSLPLAGMATNIVPDRNLDSSRIMSTG